MVRAQEIPLLTTCILFLASAPLPAQDDAVEALLARMSVVEKVGQMTQMDLSTVSAVKGAVGVPHRLDPDKLREVVVERAVGSILNACEIAHTPEHWHEILRSIQELATTKTRHGIPVIYALDSIHGANYVRGATLFPHQLNLAASFDDDLVKRTARVTARDTRAVGIPWNFAPVVDVGRMPLWSRFFETFGEDVLVSRRMGLAALRGLQGENLAAGHTVAGCLKHFVGYSMPRTGRDRTPAWIPERQLREIFLPPFRDGVAAGARTVMVNSGDIAGVPVHTDRHLLTGVLREELGFDGVVVTDWEDVHKLVSLHRVAGDMDEATRLAIEAGIDMVMAPLDFQFTDALVRLVERGAIPERRLDASVRRILHLKRELGLFERPVPTRPARVRRASDTALSRAAAVSSMVLLKNEGVLPLDEASRLVVTGPAATRVPMWHGAWTWTWQGREAGAYPPELPSFAKAARARLGPDRVHLVPTPAPNAAYDAAWRAAGEAVATAARGATAVVVLLGEEPSVEKPGDVAGLDLPGGQGPFLAALLRMEVPVVLVTVCGRPLLLSAHSEALAAHVHAGLPGPEGPAALLDLLLGERTPSARLPFTWPAAHGALFTDDHVTTERLDTRFGREAFQPLYVFGSGLGYGGVRYENVRLEEEVLGPDDELVVHLDLVLEGKRPTDHVVLLFVRDEVASITPAHRRLRDYTRVALRPGLRRRVEFRVPLNELAFVGRDHRWTLEPGRFTALVGPHALPFALRDAR